MGSTLHSLTKGADPLARSILHSHRAGFTDCNENIEEKSENLNPRKLLFLYSLLFLSALLGRIRLRWESLFGIVTRQRGGGAA